MVLILDRLIRFIQLLSCNEDFRTEIDRLKADSEAKLAALKGQSEATYGHLQKTYQETHYAIASLEEERNQIKVAWTKANDDHGRTPQELDRERREVENRQKEFYRARVDGIHRCSEFYNLKAEYDTLKTAFEHEDAHARP